MTKRPKWISKDEDGKDSIRIDAAEITVQLARYANMLNYDFRPDLSFPLRSSGEQAYERGILVAAAVNSMDARTISDWREYSEQYPEEPMSLEDFLESGNPNADVRALALQKFIGRLLEIIEAPPAMAADLETLLYRYVPRGAECRERVQRAIFDDRSASLQQIAKRAKTSAAQVSKDGTNGLLFWPADPVGSDPSGSE